MRTILVLTHEGDPPLVRAERVLRDRGARVERFDPAELPAGAALTLGYDGRGALQATLRTARGVLALNEVDAVWYRRPGRPSAAAHVRDERVREWIALESAELLLSLWQALAEIGRCRFVPAPPATFVDRSLKPHQLVLAGRLGFAIPPTLITNDPAELVAFQREHGRCITKPVEKSSMVGSRLWLDMGRYSTVLTHRDLVHAQACADCPVLAQAYVDKRVEVRVTVVGERVFAAEIHSQAARRARYDWRQYDHQHTTYRAHALPDEVAARCLELCRSLGLRYGAIDLILTPDGRYVFLEINHNGEYDWIEQRTGLPITAALCDLLMEDPHVHAHAPARRAA